MQLARLGDLVQTWPLMAQLRQVWPQARLDFLVDQPLDGLAKLEAPADEIYGLDLKELAQGGLHHPAETYGILWRTVEDLRLRNYDLVYQINFSRLSLLLSHLLGAPVRGYRPVAGGREVWREPGLALVYGLVHARIFNRLHISDVFRRLAPRGSVASVRPASPSLWREPLTVLQLATRHPKRTWPLACFTRLATLLVETLGAQIWLTGTAGERSSGEQLRQSLPPSCRERVANLQGRTSLPDLAARLKAADLVISGDTGTLHLAAALGTRVLGIFLGPASCFETGPYGPGHWVVQAEPHCHPCTEAGAACGEPVCRTMITPEVVADTAASLCGQKPFQGTAPPGVRIYRSEMDLLGVNYEIQAGKPPGWADLLGQAYRVAEARLQEFPSALSFCSPPVLSDTDCRTLRDLLDALRNGEAAPDKPAVRLALAPLWAFRSVLERQAAWQGEDEAQALAQRVKAALVEEVGKYVC